MKSLLKRVLPQPAITFIRQIFPSEVQRQITAAKKAEVQQRANFYSSFLKKGEVCFDIGANMGNRVEPFLLLGAKVIAVEPQQDCIAFLTKKFGKKIAIVQKGVGEIKGIKSFYVSNVSPMSSFSEEWISSVKDDRFNMYTWAAQPVDMEMTTLDELIALYGLPAFIKIDVEGYELEVLGGLTHKVPMMSFEYTVPELTHKVVECINRIRQCNADIELNYSEGESMELSAGEWLNADEMIMFVNSPKFIETRFGDIYVRSKSTEKKV
ncbi:FkbM family methyltransferase [Mucilaginibacter sp. HD30]